MAKTFRDAIWETLHSKQVPGPDPDLYEVLLSTGAKIEGLIFMTDKEDEYLRVQPATYPQSAVARMAPQSQGEPYDVALAHVVTVQRKARP